MERIERMFRGVLSMLIGLRRACLNWKQNTGFKLENTKGHLLDPTWSQIRRNIFKYKLLVLKL